MPAIRTIYGNTQPFNAEIVASGFLVFTAYAKGQRLIARRHADAGGHDVAVEELLRLPEVDYIEVRDPLAKRKVCRFRSCKGRS